MIQIKYRRCKKHFGFVWHNQPLTGISSYDGEPLDAAKLSINGSRNDESNTKLGDISEQEAYPSSEHPGGVNMAFCDGHVQFIRDSVDRSIYAQMMTTKYKKSYYFEGSTADRNLPQPTMSDL